MKRKKKKSHSPKGAKTLWRKNGGWRVREMEKFMYGKPLA
jgi:hypothetical protein